MDGNIANPSCSNPGRTEKIFTLLFGASKGFIKLFEALKRRVKTKNQVNFHFNTTFWDAAGEKG